MGDLHHHIVGLADSPVELVITTAKDPYCNDCGRQLFAGTKAVWPKALPIVFCVLCAVERGDVVGRATASEPWRRAYPSPEWPEAPAPPEPAQEALFA